MTKLGFAAQDISICLRCQYRLSLRKRPHPKQPQNPQQLRSFVLGRGLQQEQSHHGNVDSHDETSYPPPESLPPPSFTITYEPHKPPHKAVSWKRVQGLLPPKDSLGVESLGQPAEVLILKNPQQRGNRVEPSNALWVSRADNDSATEMMSSADMLKEMNAERGIVGIDQVCKNIEDVKSEWVKYTNLPQEAPGSAVSRQRYDDVTSKLCKSFTMSQLVVYWERNKNTQLADPFDLHYQYSNTLYARSAWNPGTTDISNIKAPELMELVQDGMIAGSIVPDNMEKHALRKSMLVDRILHQCWRIRPKEDESSSGEMDIRLKGPHLELIVNHKRSILKQISETYGAKVEASNRDEAIRITSDYETCLDILKLIIHTLGNIKCSTIDLPPGFKRNSGPQGPNPDKDTRDAIVNQVMQLTNTIVRENTATASKKELSIYYLGPDDEDLDDVRRLMSQVLRVQPAKGRRLLMSRAIRQPRDVPVPIDVGSALSLADRHQLWSRWCSRSIREINIKNQQEGAVTRPNTLENPLDRKATARALHQFFVAPNDIYDTSKETISQWVSNISYWDSVLLGQVLFPSHGYKGKDATPKASKTDSGLQPKVTDRRRQFVTAVPGLIRALEDFGLETIDPKTWNEEFLLIRLVPSFKNSLPVPLEVVPDLEIRIFFDDSSKTSSIRDVRLVRTNELDLLLPQNTMDLRFIRRACVYSRKGGLDTHIRQFVQESNLDIWGSGRLKTPNSLKISIPRHALGSIPDGRSTEGYAHEQVEYTFASLEHKCEVGVPFRQPGSWADLTYTTIEAGKIGGRRDELGLKQPRRPKNAHETDESKSKGEEAILDDEQHSASLLRKANGLINHIENPPDTEIKRQGHEVRSVQRRFDRVSARKKERESPLRVRRNREEIRAGRTPGFGNVGRRVPGKRIYRT